MKESTARQLPFQDLPAPGKRSRRKPQPSIHLLNEEIRERSTQLQIMTRYRTLFGDVSEAKRELAKVVRLRDRRRRLHWRARHDASKPVGEIVLWCARAAQVATVYERAVLVLLASFTNHDTRTAWPKITTMAERLCCHPRSVIRALAGLERAGLIMRRHRYRQVKGRDGQPLRRSNEYIVATSPESQGRLSFS